MASSVAIAADMAQQNQAIEIQQNLRNVLHQYFQPNELELFFADVMVHSERDEDAEDRQGSVREGRVQEVVQIFLDPQTPQQVKERAIPVLLEIRDQGGEALEFMEECLQELLKVNPDLLKAICDSLLLNISIDNPVVWTKTFEFIYQYLGKLDYKAARDLFKLVLELAQTVPAKLDSNKMHLLQVAEKVIYALCDPERNLMPMYFVINEVMKLSSDINFFPHWHMADRFLEIVDSFRDLSQILTLAGRSSLFPFAGHVFFGGNIAWRMDPMINLKVNTKGSLPYRKDVTGPSISLLYNFLLQPDAKDLIHGAISVRAPIKEKIVCIEETWLGCVLGVMEMAERRDPLYTAQYPHNWFQLVCQMMTMLMSHYISFPSLLRSLHRHLRELPYRQTRKELMWMLLQYLSGGISKALYQDFSGLLELYYLLFTGEEEKKPLTNSDKALVRGFAPACIWIHLRQKAKHQQPPVPINLPATIKMQFEFLQKALQECKCYKPDDYMLSVLCNAYSTSLQEYNGEIQPVILEFIYNHQMPIQDQQGTGKTFNLPFRVSAEARNVPLSMDFLDSVTVHVKMLLCSQISAYLNRFPGLSYYPSPAALETFCRLLMWFEFESPNPTHTYWKNICQLLAFAQRVNAVGIFSIVAEMLTHRLQLIPVQFRYFLLLQLQNYVFNTPPPPQCGVTPQDSLTNSVSPLTRPDFYWIFENTFISNIWWLNSTDLYHLQTSAFHHGYFLYSLLNVMPNDNSNRPSMALESEEIAKIYIMVFARNVTIARNDSTTEYFRDLITRLLDRLQKVNPSQEPLYFSRSTLSNFSPQFAEILNNHAGGSTFVITPLSTIKKDLRPEYARFTNCNDQARLDYFTSRQSQGNTKLLLCLIFAILHDHKDQPFVVIYRILSLLGPRTVIAQLRVLIDYLVEDIVNAPDSNACARGHVRVLSDFVWKCHIVPMERLLLTLVLRPYDDTELTASILLLDSLIHYGMGDVPDQIQFLLNNFHPDHWTMNDFYTKHVELHDRFRERYWEEMYLQDNQAMMMPGLPSYFSNTCVRLLPIVDIIIYRYLELCDKKGIVQCLENLLRTFGPLYRYHPRPIMLLFNLFHYYNTKLIPRIRRLLIEKVVEATDLVHPMSSWLSAEYAQWCQQPFDEVEWFPAPRYYRDLVDRFVGMNRRVAPPPGERKSGGPGEKLLFYNQPNCRFGEFPNAGTGILHMTCVELMGLLATPQDVGTALVDCVLAGYHSIESAELGSWNNAIALILTSLPNDYQEALYKTVLNVIQSPVMEETEDIFGALKFDEVILGSSGSLLARLLALCHAFFQHSANSILVKLPRFIHDNVLGLVKTENQLMFVCHLIGPFIVRNNTDKPSIAFTFAKTFYEMLLNVDKNASTLKHEETIAGFSYHLKYHFVGESVRAETEQFVPQLRPSLQKRLRYIDYKPPTTSNSGDFISAGNPTISVQSTGGNPSVSVGMPGVGQ